MTIYAAGRAALLASRKFTTKHYKTASNAVKEMSSKVSTRYHKLSGTKKAAIKGFGTGLKYGTFGVGVLAVGKGAHDIATGKRSVTLKKSDPRYKALKRKGFV